MISRFFSKFSRFYEKKFTTCPFRKKVLILQEILTNNFDRESL